MFGTRSQIWITQRRLNSQLVSNGQLNSLANHYPRQRATLFNKLRFYTIPQKRHLVRLELTIVNQSCHCDRMQRMDQDGQRLIPRGPDNLTVMDCLCLSFGYKIKTVRSQQRVARILKRPNSLRRLGCTSQDTKPTSGPAFP